MLEGQDFVTGEQAMMWKKAMLFDDSEIAAAIQEAQDPGKQKALGRKVRGFDEATWDAHKRQIVTEVSRAKYLQNKGLRRKLFQTAPKKLVEASPFDVIWGIGLDAADAQNTTEEYWPGQNLLGQILTQVREELARDFPEEARACAAEPTEIRHD